MNRLTPPLAAFLVLSAAAVAAAAQEPGTPAAAAAPQAPAEPAAPTPPPNFSYVADGRRDPFVSLINRGETRGVISAELRAEGLPGITTDELIVRGIIESKGVLVAMVSGPNGKVYTTRPGDRLADGVVQSITPQAVVVLQQVEDAMTPDKQRQVRKFLRGGENK
jgi:Tfp pilus assembly protein PilP